MIYFAATYDLGGPPPGQTAGSPIVFVHGTRLTRSCWAGQMADLGRRHRVVAPDLPGHGAMADVPFTLEGAAQHAARVIEDAAGGSAIVVGLSLGGYVAMDLAARRPELVRGLVLSGATAEPVGLRATPYRALAWAMERFDGPTLDRLSAAFFRARYGPAIAEPIIAGGFWSVGGAAALRTLLGQRFAPRLAAYPGPTLILNGTWDVLFRLGAGALAGAARRPTQVRLAAAAHLANLDRPRAFGLAVERFSATLDRSS
ncbi:MAG: alpha/beta hydrolase [Candidatus Limnocylindrales bacterium]